MNHCLRVGVGGPVGSGKTALLRQLCLHMAFPTEQAGSSLLPAYLSGESRLLLENFPVR